MVRNIVDMEEILTHMPPHLRISAMELWKRQLRHYMFITTIVIIPIILLSLSWSSIVISPFRSLWRFAHLRDRVPITVRQ
jgi:hypothetical protein